MTLKLGSAAVSKLYVGAANVSKAYFGTAQVYSAAAPALTVYAFVGSGSGYLDDPAGTTAKLNLPNHLTMDGSGNIYVADRSNNRVRKVTSGGAVTTLAGQTSIGSADGTGAAASFNAPRGITFAPDGNLYVADSSNHKIRKVTLAGVVTTLAGSGGAGSADGAGASATFNVPFGIDADSDGNLYVTENNSSLLRKVTPAGVVSTLVSSGLSSPKGVAIDRAGGLIYVCDSNNLRVVKITLAGVVTLLAGSGVDGSTNGTGAAAKFSYPQGLAFSSGNLYVADGSFKVRKIVASSAVVTTYAGTGTSGGTNGDAATVAQFAGLVGIVAAPTGEVYVSEDSNHRIRKIV